LLLCSLDDLHVNPLQNKMAATRKVHLFRRIGACSVVCAQDAEELDLSRVDLTTLAAESDMAFLSEAFFASASIGHSIRLFRPSVTCAAPSVAVCLLAGRPHLLWLYLLRARYSPTWAGASHSTARGSELGSISEHDMDFDEAADKFLYEAFKSPPPRS
jgi:hypothetical protein